MQDTNAAAAKASSDRYHSDLVIDCESRAFRQFSLKMDRQLRRLVAEWIHLAAPNAGRAQRRVSQASKLPK